MTGKFSTQYFRVLCEFFKRVFNVRNRIFVVILAFYILLVHDIINMLSIELYSDTIIIEVSVNLVMDLYFNLAVKLLKSFGKE